MSDRSMWAVTTHDWTSDVDRDHLALVQAHRDVYGAGGARHLILEVLSYANDEAESLGRVGHATVTLGPHGTARVSDDGRGTDTRTDIDGRVIRKPVMATRDVRYFDDSDAPLLPDGLPRCGMSTVAALSSWLVHENHRTGGSWSQTYRHGIPEEELRAIDATDRTGTCVTFRADLPGPNRPTAEDLVAFRWVRVEVRDSDTELDCAFSSIS